VILLDTHAWLWLGMSPRRLSAAATSAIQAATNSGGLDIASVTLVEVAWLMARGRLRLQGTPETLLPELLDSTGVVVKEITPAIAALFTHFPDAVGHDPVDRVILATARLDGMPLVTRDRRMRAQHMVQTVW
jgi:PIN domain nuclease of toxin-antitoxin system